jgi:hypothetical protein
MTKEPPSVNVCEAEDERATLKSTPFGQAVIPRI